MGKKEVKTNAMRILDRKKILMNIRPMNAMNSQTELKPPTS